MYYLHILLLSILCLAHSNYGLTLVFPTLNDSVRPSGSGMVTWRDNGDVTALNVYLAHGTPENYTILQVIGANVPSSTGIMMYHLPSTLPNDQVFFMLEGNDTPKTIITRSVYVEPGFVFPSISLPSGFPSITLPAGFPSISLPFNLPTAQPSPSNSPTTQTSTTDDDGPSTGMIVGIIVGVVGFFSIILVVAILRKRRTIRRKRLALELLRQHNEKRTPPPPPPPQKSVDLNVNVAIQPMQEQQQQHTEYNVNYQPEYNYNPQYQYDQQLNYEHTMNQPPQSPYTSSPIGPGGFVTPSSPPPKYLIPTGTSVSPISHFGNGYPTHDNGLHASTISTSSTVIYPPDPTYQKFTGVPNQQYSSKMATTENKPDDATAIHHKPEQIDTHKPHFKPVEHKPHSVPK